MSMPTPTDKKYQKYLVSVAPVRCGYTLASAQWDRNDLALGLMKATEPPGWIHRKEAEAFADAIIAATNQDVEELPAEIEP